MMLLALKTITRRGVIGTISPVFGFLPTRSDFCLRPKEPKEDSLIGSPRSLTALTHAAQADADRDVRRSAQFAVEVIQANQRPR